MHRGKDAIKLPCSNSGRKATSVLPMGRTNNRNEIINTHIHTDLIVNCRNSLQQRIANIRKSNKYKKVLLECSKGGSVSTMLVKILGTLAQ